MRGQFAWLVCLAEAALSTRRPCWFRSQDDLAARYGDPVWRQARRLAADLNEPRDPEVLVTLADLIEQRGSNAVQRAHAATIRLKKGSARRHLRTTLAALAAER
ncbi:hypothetical protein HQ590_00630 [bacterium]|nr:hypothetical protein [bacterium]